MIIYCGNEIIKKVVITGEIASGKSTVLSVFRQNGFRVFSADYDARQLMQTKDFVDELDKNFGMYPGDDLFKNEFFLNENLYDFVRKTIYPKLYKNYSKEYLEETVIYETPLYFESLSYALESGFYPDFIIYVTASSAIRKKRMYDIRKMSDEDIRHREKYFYPNREKLAESDFVIYNNKKEKDLIKLVENFINEKTKKSN